MIQSDGNGSYIIKKSTLIPLGLVLTLLFATFAFAGMYYGIKSQVQMNTYHRISEDVHQPFEEKFETWLTRKEGEEMQAELKHVLQTTEQMSADIQVLLERTRHMEGR